MGIMWSTQNTSNTCIPRCANTENKLTIDLPHLRYIKKVINTILHQFAKCSESVKLEPFRSFCTCYLFILLLSYTKGITFLYMNKYRDTIVTVII